VRNSKYETPKYIPFFNFDLGHISSSTSFWNNPNIYSHADVNCRAYSFHFIFLAFAVRTALQNVSLKKTTRKMGNENDMLHPSALID
jgi:hypothetical protein